MWQPVNQTMSYTCQLYTNNTYKLQYANKCTEQIVPELVGAHQYVEELVD